MTLLDPQPFETACWCDTKRSLKAGRMPVHEALEEPSAQGRLVSEVVALAALGGRAGGCYEHADDVAASALQTIDAQVWTRVCDLSPVQRLMLGGVTQPTSPPLVPRQP